MFTTIPIILTFDRHFVGIALVEIGPSVPSWPFSKHFQIDPCLMGHLLCFDSLQYLNIGVILEFVVHKMRMLK